MGIGNYVPNGLSWGTRGFRVGKSNRGNWWVSIGLPFGFRYTWFLGGASPQERQYRAEAQQRLPKATNPVLPPLAAPRISHVPPSANSASQNHAILESIKRDNEQKSGNLV